MTKYFGICFSKKPHDKNPLSHLGIKLPVYIELLNKCKNEGWEVYVLTKTSYLGDSVFRGGWHFKGDNKVKWVDRDLKMDLVYDRTGGLEFPLEDNHNFVNIKTFKTLCWDKWKAYQEYGKYMPATYWVGKGENLKEVLNDIKSKYVVLKPYNGLKGLGIYICNKTDAIDYKFSEKYPLYIAQEFIETKQGIDGITTNRHDFRVVVINGKIVWCHLRTPPDGSLKANVAGGGSIEEIGLNKIPSSVKEIVSSISKAFFDKYDNPIFSLDFGIDKNGIPHLFEINDTIGFPRWEMKNKDSFLKELVLNFKAKIEYL